jgi:hypothetical protein
VGVRGGGHAHGDGQHARRVDVRGGEGVVDAGSGDGEPVGGVVVLQVERALLPSDLDAAQVGHRGEHPVLPGVDADHVSGVGAQLVEPCGAALRGGVGRALHLADPAELDQLPAPADHGGAGEACRVHRLGRREDVVGPGELEHALGADASQES